MRRQANLTAALILAMVATCILLVAAPILHALAQPAVGAATAPDRRRVQGMQMTMAAAVARSQDVMTGIADREKAALAKKAELARQASALRKQAAAKKAEQVRAKASQTETTATGEGTPIMGASTVTAAQMADLYERRAKYPSKALAKGGADTVDTFCRIIVEEAEAEGVRAEVIFAQAMLETGWLKFKGADSISQFNFAGLGTVAGGKPGNAFADVRTGIRAQVQHLKAYASTDDLVNPLVDQRFKYVRRGVAPYVEWLGIQENPYGVGWASGQGYGGKLLKIMSDIRS